MNNKLKSSLGLAKKAGALTAGHPAVLEKVKKGKAALVLTARDISEESFKKLSALCLHKNVEIIKTELTKSEISESIGLLRQTAVVSIAKKEILNLVLSSI